MISLQVGQAGCQMGEAFHRTLDRENNSKTRLRYPYNTFRQLVVDTERKTWRSRSKQSEKLLFDSQAGSFAVDSRGRGNNWAMGYYGGGIHKNDSEKETEAILELYRRQMEGLDNYEGCFLMHSLSGGTGSGLGSRLIEEIRMTYDKNYIITASVLPFRSGETPLQHYNSLLSLACLQEYTDCIGLISNDIVYDALTRQKFTAASHMTLPKIGMSQLNVNIATTLAGVFLPGTAESVERKDRRRLQPFSGWDLIYNTSPIPVCKMIQFASSAKETTTFRVSGDWNQITSTLLSYVGAKPERCTYAAQLTVRGIQDGHYWTHHQGFLRKLKGRLGCARWNPFPVDVRTADSTSFQNPALLQSVSLAYNSSDASEIVNYIASKAEEKYRARAFLHWYTKYGDENMHDVFDEAFETLRTTVDYYQQFCAP